MRSWSCCWGPPNEGEFRAGLEPSLLNAAELGWRRNAQVVYWVNTSGLSLPYRRVLTAVVEGLCAMG